VHSSEEISALEKATEVSEAGLKAMMDTARPGSVHRDVWLSMYRAMVQASGERPWRLSISAGSEGNGSFGFPLEDVFHGGQILSQECSGSVLGYGSQVNHSVLLGGPAPADWASAGQSCLDLFHALVDRIGPGKSIKEFCDFYGEQLAIRSWSRIRARAVLASARWNSSPSERSVFSRPDHSTKNSRGRFVSGPFLCSRFFLRV
jgi:hypothetical protein